MDNIVNFEKLLKASLDLPGVKINRENFLRSALTPHFDKEIVDKAILLNPAKAGIKKNKIEEIANLSIDYETSKVTMISFIYGMPGGPAMLGAIPADLIQYFGHIIRILQKLIYLYGWQELFDKNVEIDDETLNLIIIFLGIMFGVNGAVDVISKFCEQMSKNMAQKVVNDFAQKMLIKNMISPTAKKVVGILSVKLTKKIFTNTFAKFVPILGGFVSGGMTYITYKQMAIRLKEHLSKMRFSDLDDDMALCID